MVKVASSHPKCLEKLLFNEDTNEKRSSNFPEAQTYQFVLILIYGVKTWSLTESQRSQLKICQRALERSILMWAGCTWKDGQVLQHIGSFRTVKDPSKQWWGDLDPFRQLKTDETSSWQKHFLKEFVWERVEGDLCPAVEKFILNKKKLLKCYKHKNVMYMWYIIDNKI